MNVVKRHIDSPAFAHSYVPEGELLLYVLRSDVGAEEVRKRAAHADIDWWRFQYLAQSHGVLPLVAYRFRGLGIDNDALEVRAREMAVRSMELLAELQRLSALFEERSIQVIPFKGCALAPSVYKAPELRTQNDLDFLVSKAELNRAEELLFSLGYQPAEPLSAAQKSFEIVFQNAFEYEHPISGIAVDLHWRPVRNFYGQAISMSKLLQDGTTLSALHHFTLLVVHGGKHGWDELKWVVDIAQIIDGWDYANFNEAITYGEQTGTKRMTLLALGLSRDLLGASISAESSNQIDSDQIVVSLIKQIRENIVNDQQFGTIDMIVEDIRMRERVRDKLHYLFFRLLTPHGEDWRFVKLPNLLFPLYFLIRPIRLALRYLGRVFSTKSV